MAHIFIYTNSCHSYLGLETFGTLSRNICAVYCEQTGVISVSVSGWKKWSVSLSWGSQHSLLAETQSCGKCSPVASSPLQFPQSREKAIIYEGKLLQNICWVLCPVWQSTVRLLQGCRITIIQMQSPTFTTVKNIQMVGEHIWTPSLMYINTEALAQHLMHMYYNHIRV